MKKNIVKYYLKNKQVEKMAEEFIDKLRKAETYFLNLSDEMGEIRDKYEVYYVIDEIRRLNKQGKLKQVSTSWLMRKYKIGYARSARFIDVLNQKKIIKPSKKSKDNHPTLWEIR